jgi:hypothetical protein
MAFFKPKDQSFVEHRQVGDIIIFDDMHILGVGNAEGEPIQIDFSLYSLVGSNPVLLAQKRSPPITVFNHSQYLPAPSITKLLPNWTFVGQRPKVEVFGPLFLRKNNILECQIIEEDGREIALLKGNAILRKRNCFHSFSFTAPDHPPGRVWVRARYKDREFGEGRPFEYWSTHILRALFSWHQVAGIHPIVAEVSRTPFVNCSANVSSIQSKSTSRSSERR